MSGADLAGCAPSSIPGPPHADNSGALDWSAHGLIAYGCHDVVVVFEPTSCEVVQTLDCAGARVTRVCWAPRETSAALARSPRRADLLVGDRTGHVSLWDVARGAAAAHCPAPTAGVDRAVAGLAWHPAVLAGALVLHAGGSLALWSFAKPEARRVWAFADPAAPLRSLPSFHADDSSIAAAVGSGGWVLRLRGGGGSTPPTVDARDRFRIVDPAASAASEERGAVLGVCYCPLLAHAASEVLLMLTARELLAVDTSARAAVGATAALGRHAAPFAQLLVPSPAARAPELVLCAHADGSVSAYAMAVVDAAVASGASAAAGAGAAADAGLASLVPALPRARLRFRLLLASHSLGRELRGEAAHAPAAAGAPMAVALRALAGDRLAALGADGCVTVWSLEALLASAASGAGGAGAARAVEGWGGDRAGGPPGAPLAPDAPAEPTAPAPLGAGVEPGSARLPRISAPAHGGGVAPLPPLQRAPGPSAAQAAAAAASSAALPPAPPQPLLAQIALFHQLGAVPTCLAAGPAAGGACFRHAAARGAADGGGLLAIGTARGTICIFSLARAALLSEVRAHAAPVRGLRWAGSSCLVSFASRAAELGASAGAGARAPEPAAAASAACWEVHLIDLASGEVRALPHSAAAQPDDADGGPPREGAAGAEGGAAVAAGAGAGAAGLAQLYALRPSPSGCFLCLLFKDAPLQLWDLGRPRPSPPPPAAPASSGRSPPPRASLPPEPAWLRAPPSRVSLRSGTFPVASTLEWEGSAAEAPPDGASCAEEAFLATTVSGELCRFAVAHATRAAGEGSGEGGGGGSAAVDRRGGGGGAPLPTVRAASASGSPELCSGIVSALAAGGGWLVSGDTGGNVVAWFAGGHAGGASAAAAGADAGGGGGARAVPTLPRSPGGAEPGERGGAAAAARGSGGGSAGGALTRHFDYSRRGIVRRIRLAPGGVVLHRVSRPLALLLFADGSLAIIDLRSGTQFAAARPAVRAIEVDWTCDGLPLACTEGGVRIFDVTLSTANAPLSARPELGARVCAPALLSRGEEEALKCALLLGPDGAGSGEGGSGGECAARHPRWAVERELLVRALGPAGAREAERVGAAHGGGSAAACALRGLHAARALGLGWECRFWAAVLETMGMRLGPGGAAAPASAAGAGAGAAAARARWQRESALFGGAAAATPEHARFAAHAAARGGDVSLGAELLLAAAGAAAAAGAQPAPGGADGGAAHALARCEAEADALLAVALLGAARVPAANGADGAGGAAANRHAGALAAAAARGAAALDRWSGAAHEPSFERGVSLLCATGQAEAACARLQSRGRWREAAALAQSALDPGGCARVLEGWAEQAAAGGGEGGGSAVRPLRAIELRLLACADDLSRVVHWRAAEPAAEGGRGDAEAGARLGRLQDALLQEGLYDLAGHLARVGAPAAERVGPLLESAAWARRLRLPAECARRFAALASAASGGLVGEGEAEQLAAQVAAMQAERELRDAVPGRAEAGASAPDGGGGGGAAAGSAEGGASPAPAARVLAKGRDLFDSVLEGRLPKGLPSAPPMLSAMAHRMPGMCRRQPSSASAFPSEADGSADRGGAAGAAASGSRLLSRLSGLGRALQDQLPSGAGGPHS